jgi:hypothetical protein
MPIIITEPAVGYGAGLFGAYFHGSIEEWSRKNNGRFRPPSISVVGGFATENGSWGAVAGHFGVWFQDRVRYLGAVGWASPNLTTYPAVLDGQGVEFNLEGLVVVQQAKARVAGDLFAGLRYVYFGSTVTFELDSALPGIVPRQSDIATGGIAAMVEWEARDNSLSPTRGTRIQVTGSFFGPGLGGDSTYQQVNGLLHQYVPLTRTLDLALRLDGTLSTDGAPFFARPFVRLRGVPVMRYQGRAVGVTEAELRHALNRRWSLVAFGGVGFTDNGRDSLLHSSETIVAGGAGFRYLVARQLGLQAGVDVAWGPEEGAVYLQMGHAWF